MSLQWLRRYWDAREHTLHDVVGGDVLRESLERQHDAMAQHIEREVLYVLTGDVSAAPEIGKRATGEDEVDRSARARAVADVLGDVADAVFGRLPRRGGQPDDVFHERRIHEDIVDLALQLQQAVRRHHRDDRRHVPGHPLDDDEFVHLARVSDQNLEHEPVDLGLRERVGALGLDRVLSRHDQERIWDLVRLTPNRDLALLHDFEERALHFRRRAVDLIREEKVGEDRAERCLEVAGALVVDPCADEVGGNQVGRELDPLEVSGDRLRDRLYREGLSETGYPFDKQVATREETDHEALDQVVLPDDHLLDLE